MILVAQKDKIVSYFQDGMIIEDGSVFRFSAEEAQALVSVENYWLGPGDPSSWLAVAVISAIRVKFETLEKRATLVLAARVLGISQERLTAILQWHEKYMRWYGGDPDYKAL
jgi:hypothetical protein